MGVVKGGEVRDQITLTETVYDGRVRTALAEEKGPVTVRALCEARGVPPTHRAEWSRAAKRLVARGEAAAEALLNPGGKTCLSNPMYYRLLENAKEEKVTETTTTQTNGDAGRPGWYPKKRGELKLAPASERPQEQPAEEPAEQAGGDPPATPAEEQEPVPLRRRRRPTRRYSLEQHLQRLTDGILTHTPTSATQLYREHYEGKAPSGLFLDALRKMVADGGAEMIPRPGNTRKPSFGDCDLYRLAGNEPRPAAAESAPKNDAREALVEAARAAHANWIEAKELANQSEQEVKDAAFKLFCFDQGIG